MSTTSTEGGEYYDKGGRRRAENEKYARKAYLIDLIRERECN